MIPLGFLFWFMYSKTEEAPLRYLPYFGPKNFTGEKDTTYHTVPGFSFVDQYNNTFSDADTKGKIYVTEYFFTTCKSICPIMNTNIKQVYELYKNNPGFLILSHTCDPANDSPERLKTYSDSLRVNTQHWWFLTGRKDSLYNTARNSYLLDDPKNNLMNINEQFLHTQFIALVDKNGKVRKIYDGLKKEELEEMKKDIGNLLKES